MSSTDLAKVFTQAQNVVDAFVAKQTVGAGEKL